MSSQIAIPGADDDVDLDNNVEPNLTDYINDNEVNIRATTESVVREMANNSEDEVSSSSYILANDLSQLSRDVDRWINGSVTSTPTESTGVQGIRRTVIQRSTLTSSCTTSDTLWYMIAMMMPMLSVHNCVMTLRCTPSNIVNIAEVFFHNLSRICANAKHQIQRIAREQVARDLFATAMDVLLLVYALGFLVLSMYQASIIG